MKAIILAAGRGERMRPFTDDIPKPLLEVNGRSLIEYRIEALAKAGVKDVVINVSYLREKIMQKLGDGKQYGVNIDYSVEDARLPLETGGGIFYALPKLGNKPFVAINADLWTDFDMAMLPKTPKKLAHLVLVDNPEHHRHGDFCLRENQVTMNQGERFTFSGIGVYHPALFAACKPGAFRLADVLIQAIAQGQVTGEYYNGAWSDVGTPQRLEKLRQPR